MAIFEMIGICWVYGLNNVCEDIEFMLNIKITFYWKFCWAFFIPVGLSTILLYTFVNHEELTYNDVTFPDSYISEWNIKIKIFDIICVDLMGNFFHF